MPVPCKICGASASLHGVVDFNKNCETFYQRFFPLAGVPVWYHRCAECGFLFTTHFDHWTPDDWRREVYNDGYTAVDHEQANGARALRNLESVTQVVRAKGTTRILDYGGGDGLLTRLLCEKYFDAQTWDPLVDTVSPTGDFDLVTSFEVLEHTTTPRATLADMLTWVRPGGLVFFSTLTLDDLPEQACDHFYIAPRNGHVSIHTTKSLDRMFSAAGWAVRHLSAGVHLAEAV